MAKRDPNPPIVTRMPTELVSAIDDDAKRAGVTRSDWMREVAQTALTWNWMARNRPVLIRSASNVHTNGERRLGMDVLMPSGECLHPPTAREQYPTKVTCGMCGAILKTL